MAHLYSDPVTRLCKALVDAGITDAQSQECINFCTTSCPYDFCIAVEDVPKKNKFRHIKLIDRIKSAIEQGRSVEQIGLLEGLSPDAVAKFIIEHELGKS